MEDGTVTLPGGSDDHHDDTNATADDKHNDSANHARSISFPEDGMKFPWTSSSSSAPSSPISPPASPTSSSPKQQSHRRTVSGSLLGRLNFLRNVGTDVGRPPSREKEPKSPKKKKSFDDDVAVVSPVKELREESAMSSALKQSKTQRKRKGSLRKTALLGGKRFASEGRERKGSLLQRSPTKQTSQPTPPETSPEKAAPPSSVVHFDSSAAQADDERQHDPIRRQFSYESSLASSTSTESSNWSEPAAVTAARLSLVTDAVAAADPKASSEASLQSPLDLKSPTSQASYTSTTDDDDILTFDRPTANSALLSSPKKPLPPSAGSYFPPPSAIAVSHSGSRSRSRTHRPSPLIHTPLHPPYPPSPPEPYDYTETAYWGWVLLAVTWIVFTVGMGSCLDVWSWAWDVPEKPYAPPELEDDPTLPIVGYYPALIVLTGVVSWVWITVAWVGMKYFRHARVEV